MRNTVLTTSLIFSLALVVFSSAKHLLLGSATWDLGIFEQFSWLIVNKGIFSISSLRGVSPLQDHFSLLLIPIAYLYKLFPSTLTLLIIQSLCLGILPYLALKDKSFNKLYIGLLVVILFSPIIFLVNLANFHPEVVSIPFMFIAIKESIKDRKYPYYISFFLSIAAKKSQLLFGLGLSIYALTKGSIYRGFTTLLISISWWVIASKYSAISGDYIKERLGYLGDSIFEIILELLTKPWNIFIEAPPDQIILYSVGLILPFVVLLGKESFPGLLAISPIYFANIISSAGSQRELYSQYSISILPFLIVACLDSIDVKINLPQKFINRIYFSTILLTSIAFIGYSRIGYFYTRYLPNFSESVAFHKIKATIPEKSSILTNSQFGAHLANRYLLHIIEDDNYNEIHDYDYIILPKSNNLISNKKANFLNKENQYNLKCYEPNHYHVVCKK